MTRLLVFVLSTVLGVGLAVPGSAADLVPGDPAPTFELPGSDGNTYRLSDILSKQVAVVAWFPKAFTGGCTAECKSMKESGEALKKFEVAYFTASCDDAETNKKFAQSLGLDFPILSDANHKVAEAYGVWDPNRKVSNRVTFYIGKDGKILHVDKSVNTKQHGPDIAAKLRELGVAEKK